MTAADCEPAFHEAKPVTNSWLQGDLAIINDSVAIRALKFAHGAGRWVLPAGWQ